MAIVRVHKHTDNFSIIENTAAHDERLSWKAKGIHWYCLTQPDDWEIVQSELVKHASDGKSGLTSGIRELVMYGYWNIDSFQDEQGRFQTVYDVFESPKLNRRFQEESQKTGQQKRSIAIKSRKKSPLPKISNGEKKQVNMKENTGEITVTENQQRAKNEEVKPLPKTSNGDGKKAEMHRNTSKDRKNITPLPKISNGEKTQNHRYRKSATTKDYNMYIDLDLKEREKYKRERKEKVAYAPLSSPSSKPKSSRSSKKTKKIRPDPDEKPYGEYQHVCLSDKAYQDLLAYFDQDESHLKFWISLVDEYLEQHPEKQFGQSKAAYQQHHLVIRSFHRREPDQFFKFQRARRQNGKQSSGIRTRYTNFDHNMQILKDFEHRSGKTL